MINGLQREKKTGKGWEEEEQEKQEAKGEGLKESRWKEEMGGRDDAGCR